MQLNIVSFARSIVCKVELLKSGNTTNERRKKNFYLPLYAFSRSSGQFSILVDLFRSNEMFLFYFGTLTM